MISPETIDKLLGKLKCNSAAGPDGLPPIFFNKTKGFINFPTAKMFADDIKIYTELINNNFDINFQAQQDLFNSGP